MARNPAPDRALVHAGSSRAIHAAASVFVCLSLPLPLSISASPPLTVSFVLCLRAWTVTVSLTVCLHGIVRLQTCAFINPHPLCLHLCQHYHHSSIL